MAKRVTADTLAAEIQNILDDYADDVSENLNEITKAVTKKGVQALKNESADKFGTVPSHKIKYAKSWTAKYTEGRLNTIATIYNKKPHLPHLLEFGHAMRGGGRSGFVPGRTHIAKVEKTLIEEFESSIERIL